MSSPATPLPHKDALIILSHRFNGNELFGTLNVLQECSITWKIVSQEMIVSDEITGEAFRADGLLNDILQEDVSLYPLLFIVSGNMQDTEYHWNHPVVEHAVRTIHSSGGVVAAICCSTPNVRHVAKGVKVACFPLIRIKAALRDAGAILTGRSIEADNRIVTAEHQMATLDWAQAAVNLHQHGKTDVPEGNAQEYFKFWSDIQS